MILVRVVAPVANGPRRGQSIQALVDVVHALNVAFLRGNPRFPSLYKSGVVYAREPRETREEFCCAPAVLAQGWGDCDDLAPWRSSDLVVRHGIAARPKVLRVGPRTWHVVVELPGGKLEDPSARLGMVTP